MVKTLLFITILFLAGTASSQDYERIRSRIAFQQYKAAKDELDRSMNDPKIIQKPESFIMKAALCAKLATDQDTKGTTAGMMLISDADVAFKRYRELDPNLHLLDDPFYKEAPLAIYSAYYSAGFADYQNKDWVAGLEKFRTVITYSDFLIAQKLLPLAADTNSLLLAGILAENAGLKEEAVKYYTRITSLNVADKEFEGIYRFLVNYYVGKKDAGNFEKYRALGKQRFPQSSFFTYDLVDFAVGRQPDFTGRLQALEELLARDGNNYKAQLMMAQLIFDTLHAGSASALPAQANELEMKMLKAFAKAALLKPGEETPLVYLGDHYIEKTARAKEEREAFRADVQARLHPGARLSREDLAKSNQLDNAYFSMLEKVRDPYEKAAAIFSRIPTLSEAGQKQYKRITGYLAAIYLDKKTRAREKSPEQKKYAQLEAKWNAVFDSMK